jgi:glycosyltransferase involved in cell wall biosynthesis
MAEFSILIPARNDAETLGAAFEEIDAVVAQASIFAEVLVIDAGSTDGTTDVAAQLAERYPNLHVRIFARNEIPLSFGGLIRFGMAHASGRYCAIVSADGTDPVGLLPEMLKRLRAGKTMVVCSRYIRNEDSTHVGRTYRAYQQIYRTSAKLLLGQEITDSTYGFRAFDRQYIQAVGASSNRFSIFPEMTFKVLESGGTIDYLSGAPQPVGVGGSEKFKLPNEIFGYAGVLGRAALHRAHVVRWF